MAVAPSARAGGATVVTPVAMTMAKPKSVNCLILLVVVHIVSLLGSEGDGVDSSRLPRLRVEAISPTRSVAAWNEKCDETVIIDEVRLVLMATCSRKCSGN